MRRRRYDSGETALMRTSRHSARDPRRLDPAQDLFDKRSVLRYDTEGCSGEPRKSGRFTPEWAPNSTGMGGNFEPEQVAGFSRNTQIDLCVGGRRWFVRNFVANCEILICSGEEAFSETCTSISVDLGYGILVILSGDANQVA